MKGYPEIFKDGFSPRWRWVEARHFKTGTRAFLVPNTLFNGHLYEITEEETPGLTKLKNPVGHAFWTTVGIANRRSKLLIQER